MRAMRKVLSVAAFAALLLVVTASLALAQTPVEPQPFPREGTTCESLGYQFGVRINAADYRSPTAAQNPDLLVIVFDFFRAHIPAGREYETVRANFFELHGFAETGFVAISGLRGFGFPRMVAV